MWSGHLRETHNGVFAHANRAVMAYNSSIDYVRTMRRTLGKCPLRIFIYGGHDDPDSAQIPGMAAALPARAPTSHGRSGAGGHSWKTWGPHADQMLMMASRDFSHPLGLSVDLSCT